MRKETTNTTNDPFKILAIDDEPKALAGIIEYCIQNRDKYDLVTESNPVRALSLIMGAKPHRKPDAIITDWDMPEMNGIELIKRIREDEDELTKGIPIIMHTGFGTSTSQIEEAIEAGATGVLNKPATPNEIFSGLIAAVNYRRLAEKHKKQMAIQNKLLRMAFHDFNNASQAIQTLLDKPNFGSDQSKISLRASLTFATKKFQEVNLLEKHSQGGLYVNKSNFSLQKTVEGIYLNLLQSKFESKQVGFVNKIKNCFVFADKPLVERVLDNLISNAWKHTHETKGIIVVQALPIEEHSQSFIKVVISNTGESISKHVKDYLFRQVISSAEDQQVEGHGHGLGICKMITDAHGTEIGLDREKKDGAAFWFTLEQSQDNKEFQYEHNIVQRSNQKIIHLTQEEKELIRSSNAYQDLKKLESYRFSKIQKIIEKIPNEWGNGVKEWKKALNDNIYHQDVYENLRDQVEN